MAGKTIGRRAFVYTVGMACITLNIGVPAGKREAGVAVIEGHIGPTAGGMAGTTVRTELSVMTILRRMARITIRRRSLVHTIGMTCTALNTSMSSRKREARVAVVETDIRPLCRFVTRSAICAKLTHVVVPGGMAGITGRGCALVYIIHVT